MFRYFASGDLFLGSERMYFFRVGLPENLRTPVEGVEGEEVLYIAKYFMAKHPLLTQLYLVSDCTGSNKRY